MKFHIQGLANIKFTVDRYVKPAVFSISLLSAPASFADITPLSDQSMANIDAQIGLGIAFTGTQLAFEAMKEQGALGENQQEMEELLKDALKHGVEAQIATQSAFLTTQVATVTATEVAVSASSLVVPVATAPLAIAGGFSLFGLPLL